MREWTTSRGERVYEFDPLDDPRWPELVAAHVGATAFHTREWLDALKRTYGYTPVAFSTSVPDGPLRDAIVFCEVRSWLTGRRLVALPFADHCDPLLSCAAEAHTIRDALQAMQRDRGWRYIELRPRGTSLVDAEGLVSSARYWMHQIDLLPEEEALRRSVHRDAIQRKIRRAMREALTCDEGRSEAMLRAFYELLLVTRRRHKVPPQPFSWFHNLANLFGPAMTVRLARYQGAAIAGVVTLRHRETTIYKYGASDARFHALGGMPLLLWRTIQDARSSGCNVLDLGRCDIDNEGLRTFKDRLGAARTPMTYWRLGAKGARRSGLRASLARSAAQVLQHAPAAVMTAAGRVLYRHGG